jgi:hypothetical protein
MKYFLERLNFLIVYDLNCSKIKIILFYVVLERLATALISVILPGKKIYRFLHVMKYRAC